MDYGNQYCVACKMMHTNTNNPYCSVMLTFMIHDLKDRRKKINSAEWLTSGNNAASLLGSKAIKKLGDESH